MRLRPSLPSGDEDTVLRTLRVRRHRLCADLAALVPETQARALVLDTAPEFPAADIEKLRDVGALAAPVPGALGGLGLGTEANGAMHLAEVLRLIGRGNPSLGRLYEAHVNALRLIMRHGTERQMRHGADLALAGQLFGLWVTDAPDARVCLTEDFVLHGIKAPCSGAGYVRHALITARLPNGETRMMMIGPVASRNADPSGWVMQGMRAARNGRMIMEGIGVAAWALIGSDGDYLREPDFSAGAWRGAAVALGGLEALVAEMRATLVDRDRATDAHQRARIGEALIALETARMWVQRAALLGEASEGDTGDIANTVNLARIAVETAGLDIIRLVQRSLGLTAFRVGTLTELLLRDLATYLRQPAPDIVLDQAAAHFTARDLPTLVWPSISP
jgi:alkylation response protein AidB-like acyl-CoA dehydrogenase